MKLNILFLCVSLTLPPPLHLRARHHQMRMPEMSDPHRNFSLSDRCVSEVWYPPWCRSWKKHWRNPSLCPYAK